LGCCVKRQLVFTTGDWEGIEFLEGAVGSSMDEDCNYLGGSGFRFVTIEYGGVGVSVDGGWDDPVSLHFDHCIVRNNSNHGIYQYNGSTCIIETEVYGNNDDGVLVDQGEVRMEGSIVRDNGEGGVNINWAPYWDLQQNLFTGNAGPGLALDVWWTTSSPPVVENNTIAYNVTGVRVGENAGVIANNAIYGNDTYDLTTSVDVTDGPVNAQQNWWGTTSREAIAQHIYDWYDNASRAVVDFEPFLTSRPPLAPTALRPPLAADISPDGATFSLGGDEEAGISVVFGAGAVSAESVMTYTQQARQSAGTLAGGDHFFSLVATQDGAPISVFSQPITIGIRYTNETRGPILPGTMHLYRLDGTDWVTDDIEEITVGSDVITSATTHFSTFALLGETLRAYLPVVVK
jgi:hypothetical protein